MNLSNASNWSLTIHIYLYQEQITNQTASWNSLRLNITHRDLKHELFIIQNMNYTLYIMHNLWRGNLLILLIYRAYLSETIKLATAIACNLRGLRISKFPDIKRDISKNMLTDYGRIYASLTFYPFCSQSAEFHSTYWSVDYSNPCERVSRGAPTTPSPLQSQTALDV